MLEVSEQHEDRRLAYSIAYRMLGSVAEAEDVVQEACLRMHRARQEGVAVESPRAYLTAVTTRLAIDQLRSARARRETYVGSWLPEPVVDEQSPAEHVELAESLSMAFLLLLETQSPVERAVFLLREVFDYSYEEIAAIVGKSETNCRQIFARAKRHIDERKPRFEPSPDKRRELTEQFFTACRNGNVEIVVNLLAEDVRFEGDGGGKATSVQHPVTGRDRVARLMLGLFAKGKSVGAKLRLATVNAYPGAVVYDAEDRIVSVFSLDVVDGVVTAIRGVVNPDKLRHIGPVSDLARMPSRAAVQ